MLAVDNMKNIKWIQIFTVIAKYFQNTIGSAFMLVLAWMVTFNKMSSSVAFEVAILLGIGGYVASSKIESIKSYFESKLKEKKGGYDAE